MSGPNTVRFPNLNALRFFAALLVVVAHTEHKKSLFKLPSLWGSSYFVSTVSYHAVTFFFVLSGFLITYLLLRERETFTRISIGKFYLRRILRIFPVYFLTIGAAFLVYPWVSLFHIPGQTERLLEVFWPALALSVFFLSNVAVAQFGNLACVDQTWSVSTEEQFYLFWPLVLSVVRTAWLPILLVSIAVAGVVLRYAVGESAGTTVKILLYLNRFGCMAIGGLAAFLVLDRSRLWFRYLTNRWVLWATLATTFAVLVFPIVPGKANGFQAEAYSLLFAIIILNFAVGSAVKAPLDGLFFRRAGDYSYAAYMYHNGMIALVCNVGLAAGLASLQAWQVNLIVYPLVLALTFVASGLSYHFLERPVLALKSRFMVVRSSS